MCLVFYHQPTDRAEYATLGDLRFLRDMGMNRPTDRTIFQNAWVVDDVEAACMKWVNEMGVGPFFITEYTNQFSDVYYRD